MFHYRSFAWRSVKAQLVRQLLRPVGRLSEVHFTCQISNRYQLMRSNASNIIPYSMNKCRP
jgi:hypothetical protein